MPQWAIALALVLAIVLVMSSMDTLLNGITSALTTELSRHRRASGSLLLWARIITAALIVIPIIVAAQGMSVLYLFFIADLVCAAVVFPVLLGLYVRNFNQIAAIASSAVGLVVGVLWFPTPGFAGWNGLPGAGDLLYSFGGALAASALLSLALWAFARWRKAAPYDFARLNADVELIEG